MKTYKRILNIDLPPGQSAFLWGPRKSGKSTFLKNRFPDSLIYDFLKTDLFLEFSKAPFLLREQLLAQDRSVLEHPVIIDEVQKIPQILDEIHWLIENKNIGFILCGSSARKLKRGKSNLLGGRAWRYEMFPLTFPEIDDFNLLSVLNSGLIPAHYMNKNYKRALRSYVKDYLKEEIFDEGLTRNIPAFSRFFDSMAYSHGELVNYLNIARECGIDSKTVKEYYQIVVDTMLGIMVAPFRKRGKREIIRKAPRFYLFDTGVAGVITNRSIKEEKGELFGKAFEHFILMQLAAHSSYKELFYDINFWRTKSGKEVDFILGRGEVAIEVKGKQRIDHKDLKGVFAFKEEHSPRKAIVVCNEKYKRVHNDITIFPWHEFLRELWEGKIIS
jgi:uncharacterized protein